MDKVLNLATLLEKSAAVHSSNIALEDLQGNKITYEELNSSSQKIKNLLNENNIRAGNRVGILVSKSIDTVKFVFSILKSGAAYIPLDNSAPISRNNFICNNCGVKAIFIEKKLILDFVTNSQFNNSYIELNINATNSLLIFTLQQTVHSEELAYIIYTSGSTGTPKGVKHTHQSAYTFINWMSKTFSITSSDRFLSYAPFHFDLSIFDIFTSISKGATLVLTDQKNMASPVFFAKHLADKKISILYATPSVLTYLAMFGKMEKYSFDLHTIIFAGEVFPINHLKILKEKLPAVTFYNVYGPTETNVCTWFKIPDIIDDLQNESYPIGKACNYAQYKILKSEPDDNGELLIAGNSLMSGYWNDEEKTKLAINIDNKGVRWYHTGDIVTVNKNNDLVYISRNDRMVKRNGYRIELNEIEKNLISNNSIVEVAVTAKSLNRQTNTIITAHLVWMENTKYSTLDLLNYCNTILPAYMIPDNFKFYKELPKTTTHKIDYNKLQSLQND